MINLKINFVSLWESWDLRKRKRLETLRYYKSTIEFAFLTTKIMFYCLTHSFYILIFSSVVYIIIFILYKNI